MGTRLTLVRLSGVMPALVTVCGLSVLGGLRAWERMVC